MGTREGQFTLVSRNSVEVHRVSNYKIPAAGSMLHVVYMYVWS